VVPDEQVELLHPLRGRELPRPESIPDHDELGIVSPVFDRFQEFDEILLEVDELEVLVPADVQVANEEVLSCHQ
jgi:hypothetical protein